MINIIKAKFHNLTSDKKFSEILTGSAWALGARVIATGLGMVTSIIIARCYGPEVLGILAVLNSFIMLATIFTVLGTNTSILRLIPEHLAKYSPSSAFKVYRKTQYFVAGVSLITSAILFYGSGFIANAVFSKPHLKFYFALAASFIVFESLMQLNTRAVRGLRLIRLFALMQLLPSLSKLVILGAITILYFHNDNPIYAMFVAITLTALVGAWIMDRVFKSKSTTDDTLQIIPMKAILAISIPMLMTATMNFVIGQTGVIMLGMYRPDEEVGYYSIAVRLATLTTFVLTAINSMAGPKFSDLFHSGNINELFYVAKKSTKLIFWATSPILLLLLITGKPIIYFLFGQRFLVSYGPMVILIIGKFFHSISGSTGIFLNMTGHHKKLMAITLASASLNIALNFFLIPPYGFYGPAVAAMSSLIFLNISSLIFIKMKYKKTLGYIPFNFRSNH